jgi:hypothetical protein
MSSIERLTSEILVLLRGEVKDLWEEEDEEFLKQLATDLAREKFLASTSDNPGEHQKNLEFLSATLQGEIAKKKLKLTRKGQEMFARVLVLVIRAVALPALGVVV